MMWSKIYILCKKIIIIKKKKMNDIENQELSPTETLARDLWNATGRRPTRKLYKLSNCYSKRVGTAKRIHYTGGAFKNTIMESVHAEKRMWKNNKRINPHLNANSLIEIPSLKHFDKRIATSEDIFSILEHSENQEEILKIPVTYVLVTLLLV